MSMKAYSSYTVIDVVDGVQWQEDAEIHPANPKEGWAYYNTKERKSYIYDGENWMIFARDGNQGPDGPGISDETSQYCQHTSYSSAPTTGWSDTFPVNWDNNKQYVWTRIKQVWTQKNDNGEFVTKYTTPMLMSQMDVATKMAQGKNQTVVEWCKANNVSIIDGSTIATGTVSAKQINTDGLQAEYIKSSDYSVSSPYSLDSLVFTMRSDGETYKVGLKQGAATETIIVPPVYDEKPVVEVDGDSFVDGKYIVKTLVLPSSITTMPFAFLEGYSILEELHIPIHTNELANNADLCFANWFGETSSEAESRLVPATLQKVVIVAGEYVPSYYFAFISSSVFLVSTIANLMASSFAGFTGKVYYCGNKENLTVAQYNGASIAGVKKEDIEEVGEYVQPTFSIETLRGFKITSVENEPMIDSPHFKVTQDGVVTASRGDIAGWEIAEDGIDKKDADGNSVVGMSSGNDLYESLVNKGGTSPIRFYAGCRIKTVEAKETITSSKQTFTYSPSDCKKILDAEYSVGTTTGGGCGFSGIGTDTLTATWSGAPNGTLTITYTYEPLNFIVLEDGSLYASAADISGTANIDAGKIGDWEITQGHLFGGDQEAEHIELSPSGGLTVQALDPLSLKEFYDPQPGVTITKRGDFVNISLPENCTAIEDSAAIEAEIYNDANNLIYTFNWTSGENNMNILASNIGSNVDINTLCVLFINAKFRQTHTEYNSVVSITSNGIAQFREIRADRYYDTQGTLLFEVVRGGTETESVYFKAVATQGVNNNTVVELTPYSDSNCSIPSKASFGAVYMDCWSTILGQDYYEYLTFNLTGASSARATMKYVPNRCTIRFYNKGQLVSYDLTLIDSVNPIFVGACGTREYESTVGTKLKFHVPCEFPS